MMAKMNDYADLAQKLVGKTVASVNPSAGYDESLEIIFTDGSRLFVYFSGGEGDILIEIKETDVTNVREGA